MSKNTTDSISRTRSESQPRRIPESIIDEAANLYAEGRSMHAVAAILRTSAGPLYNRLRSRGIRIRTQAETITGRKSDRRAFDEEGDQSIAKMYESGLIPRKIAAKLAVSTSAVRGSLQRSGVRVERRYTFNLTGQKDYFHRFVSGRECAFRSKWEIGFAVELESRRIDWAYESHRFQLSDGSVYVPDFWIPEWNAFVEVKGLMRPDAKQKLALMRTDYPERSILLFDRAALTEFGAL